MFSYKISLRWVVTLPLVGRDDRPGGIAFVPWMGIWSLCGNQQVSGNRFRKWPIAAEHLGSSAS